MPKSKEFIDSSDSDSNQESGTATTVQQSKSKSNNDNSSTKRQKTTDESDGAVASKTGPNGERLYEIGKLRYVSVSEFRGKPYINIREYYDDKGVEKPGKKGISLAADQWNKLKTLMDQVDKDLKRYR